MTSPVFLYGNAAKSVISSSGFRSYPMAGVYSELSKKSGLNLEAVISIMQHLPIFLDDNEHKQKRRKVANIYAETRNLQISNVAQCITTIMDDLANRNGEVDLLKEIAMPIWCAVASAITTARKMPVDHDLISEIPTLFNPNLSLRRRKILNDRIAENICDMSTSQKEEFFDTVALLALGVKPLTNSLALSIFKISELNDGQLLSDVDFPTSYQASALTYVDRISKCPIEIEKEYYDKGERFRCITVNEKYPNSENQKNMFGFGSHVCIGRQISLEIWSQLTISLAKVPKILHKGLLDIEATEPFLIVRKATIELTDE